jgi:flagellar capping protein FliD
MGGITTGTGIFSGIDSATLINQLISVQSRPRVLAQQRLIQLQTQQAAYLDINSRLNAFKTAAADFRLNKVFDTKQTASSDDTVLTASAGNSAIAGSYNFIIDRLVTTQQLLSRGFADQDSTAVGLDSLTFEGVEARLDRDTALSDLNNGSGVNRGKIIVNGTEVDLSRVATVGEVVEAINSAGTGVTATVRDGSFVLTGVTSLANKVGSDVLEGLGLDGAVSSTMTGTSVYGLGTNTALSSLNDGRGVGTRNATGESVFDFNITLGSGTAIGVRIGEIQEFNAGVLETVEGAASSIGQVVDRINQALTDAGETTVTASIDSANGRIQIVDTQGRSVTVSNITVGSNTTTTASDLGIAGTFAGGTVNGNRVLAGLNTTLVGSLNGGTGLGSTDGLITFDTADGSAFIVSVAGATTLDQLVRTINEDAGNPGIVASINSKGTGIQITDNTTGTGDLVISGTPGQDAAAALGIAGTFADNTTAGSNLQLAYLGSASLLANLNDGQGIGTGEFEIVDSNSLSAKITISSSDKTLDDIIRKINSAGLAVKARINDTGDGLLIEENSTTPGAAKIRITDTNGATAKALKIAGEASATGTDNFIDGSFETTLEFDPDATLKDIVTQINEAAPGARATIINDNAGATPFRLSLVSASSGSDGRFIVDAGDFDLGFRTLDEGQDARLFYGSTDAAQGVLISSSTNTVTGVIDGVTLNLKQTSEDPVTISVSADTEAIETKIDAMITAFNSVIERIDFQSRYDDETKARGPLLGDGTVLSLRNRMFAAVRDSNEGFTSAYDRLAQVGIVAGAGGKLTFDKETFREAYADDPQAVEDLFARREVAPTVEDPDGDGIIIEDPDAPTVFTSLGVIGQLEELANGYVTSIGGTLQNRANAINDQIALQQSRITSIDRGLENKRAILQRQFLAMEQAIGQFQSQGSALSQISLIG